MNLTIILVSISAILAIIGTIYYLKNIVRGKTKPRIVSWFIWSMLTAIACSASLAEGQYPTAIFLLFSSMATISIALVGWRHGNRKFERLDVFCLLGAILGLILWWVFDSPAIAILVTISTDLLGGTPTIIHSWKKPKEELAITYILSFIGVICTLLSVSDWRVSSIAYPIYSIIMNLLFSLIIVLRRRPRAK